MKTIAKNNLMNLAQFSNFLRGFVLFCNSQCASSTENNQIEQGIGSQTVSTVDRCASSFATGVKSRNNSVTSILVGDNLPKWNVKLLLSRTKNRQIVYHLSFEVGWDTSHVVVNCWQNWNRFSCHVDTSENHGRFGDTRKAGSQLLRGQVMKLKENVILFRSTTPGIQWKVSFELFCPCLSFGLPSFADFNSHCSRNDISGGQIFGDWSVSLHETFSLAVDEVSSFSTATFSDEASSSVNS